MDEGQLAGGGGAVVLTLIGVLYVVCFFFFSSRRRHTRSDRDWSSDVCSSDLGSGVPAAQAINAGPFTFENFQLGAAPGTVCPGSSACTNGAAEPAIRADNTGTFYVTSELGLSAGTLAWK